MPKVSVIIAVYNLEKYIRDAIQSVLDQTFQDFEIIVVDDGSTDKTLEIVDEMAAQDNRIVVIHQENSGKAAIARNVGILRARSELICFLDGDDLYFPDRLEKMTGIFTAYPDIDIVFHDIEVWNTIALDRHRYLQKRDFLKKIVPYIESSHMDDVYILTKKYYYFMSVHMAGATTPSIMVRNKILGNGKELFNEDMFMGQDIDLWYRLFMNRRTIFINQVLSVYRLHDCNITNNREKSSLGFIDAHSRNYYRGRKLLDFRGRIVLRKQIAEEFGHLGYLYFQEYRIKEARSMYSKSFFWWIFVLRNCMGWVKTFFPKPVIRKYRSFFH